MTKYSKGLYISITPQYCMGDYALTSEPEISKSEMAFRRVEKKVDEAFRTQDPVAYFRLINESGIPPADVPLYDLGHAIVSDVSRSITNQGGLVKTATEQPVSTGIERTLAESREQHWVKKSSGVSRDLSADVRYKTAMLVEYSDRFGPGGKQDLRGYEGTQIGHLWNRINITCHNKVEKARGS